MSDYYDIEKAADILNLTTAEVNSLRNQGKIRGVGSGSNAKFKKEDIDNYYLTLKQKKSESAFNPFGLDNEINELNEEEDLLTSEDEQELPTMMADSASFAQAGDGFLSLGKTSDIDSVADANLDDGLILVGDEGEGGSELDDLILSDAPAEAPKKEEKIEIFGIMGEGDSSVGVNSDSGLNLSGDSGISIIGGSGSGVDLGGSGRIFDDDDVMIGSSSGSSGLNLGGDSGISLLDAAAESGFSLGAAAGGSDAILELAPEDDILALIDEEVDPDTATVLGSEDDFQLQADDDLFMTDDSESSSQVIAIEDDLGELGDFAFTDELGESSVAASQADDDLFFADDSSNAASGTDSPLFTEAADPFGGGFDSMGDMGGFGSADDSAAGFGMDAADPMAAAAAGAPIAKAAGSNEPRFTGLSVTALFAMVLIMALGGSLMFELIRCMWSWSEPLTINSSILGLFGK